MLFRSHVRAQLEDRDERNSGRLAEAKGPPDPYRAEVERAVESLPDARGPRIAGATVGLAIGFVAFTLVGAPAPATPAATALPSAAVVVTGAAPAPTFPWTELVPWGVGGFLALVVAVAWAWASAHLSRDELRRVLRLRLDAVQQLWAQGGGGRRGRQAEDQLELRRHRVRRVARAAVEDALQRARCIQLAIGDARDGVRGTLSGMSVTPTSDASTDDLSRLEIGRAHV